MCCIVYRNQAIFTTRLTQLRHSRNCRVCARYGSATERKRKTGEREAAFEFPIGGFLPEGPEKWQETADWKRSGAGSHPCVAEEYQLEAIGQTQMAGNCHLKATGVRPHLRMAGNRRSGGAARARAGRISRPLQAALKIHALPSWAGTEDTEDWHRPTPTQTSSP